MKQSFDATKSFYNEKDDVVFGRKKEMAILFKELMQEIGTAISTANDYIEENELNQYKQQGYQLANGEENAYVPLTFNMILQDDGGIHKIPVSALMHNSTMKLEQVDLKIKFQLYEENGDIMVECAKDGRLSDKDYDEMNLQFRNCTASEGISRVTNQYIKKI